MNSIILRLKQYLEISTIKSMVIYIAYYKYKTAGACPGFLKGGGPISLGSLKKRSSDFKRGGSNGLKGGVQ